MGPGLLCILVVLFLVGSAVVKAIRRRGQEEAGTALEAKEAAQVALHEGRVKDALALGRKAVTRAQAEQDRNLTAISHLLYGQAAARAGEETLAAEQLTQARRLAEDQATTALALANLSMVQRRRGRAQEALDLALDAVRNVPRVADPQLRGGAGWSEAALALAQADLRQDGREAAWRAVDIFQSIEVQPGEIPGEGLAFACYAAAYAMQAMGDQEAAGFAAEAVGRFSRLHAQTPELYKTRLADAKRLAEQLGAQL